MRWLETSYMCAATTPQMAVGSTPIALGDRVDKLRAVPYRMQPEKTCTSLVQRMSQLSDEATIAEGRICGRREMCHKERMCL